MRLMLPKQENEKAEPEAAAKPGRFRLPGFHLFQNPAVGRRSEAVQPVSFMKMLRPKRLHNNLEEFYAFLRYTEITIRKQKNLKIQTELLKGAASHVFRCFFFDRYFN